MSTTSLLVLSDLHLADHHTVLGGFRPRQQAAFASLLRAALPGGPLGNSAATELIINGDCFDFLAVPPYPADGYTTPRIGLAKLAKIAAAHEPFFATLRNFLDSGGTLTFLIGNHDFELCFPAVRERVAQLIDPAGTRSARLHFCLDQRYRPIPDISIEHGNQYDFWNYTGELWDETGRARSSLPDRLMLPLGTQYMQRAALPISLRYPYFEHFAPPLGIIRQIALLSLLDPALVVATARGIAAMRSTPSQALPDLSPGDEPRPARLFAQAVPDFAAFQQDMLAHTPGWSTIAQQISSLIEREQAETAALHEFAVLQQALEQSPETALDAIFQPSDHTGDEDTTRGMLHVLRTQPEVRIALAGHTHLARSLQPTTQDQLYLNTGTWTPRYAPPTPTWLTPDVVDWLRQPDLEHTPLTDKTALAFAWINTTANQPSQARLCLWENNNKNEGNFRVIS